MGGTLGMRMGLMLIDLYIINLKSKFEGLSVSRFDTLFHIVSFPRVSPLVEPIDATLELFLYIFSLPISFYTAPPHSSTRLNNDTVVIRGTSYMMP